MAVLDNPHWNTTSAQLKKIIIELGKLPGMEKYYLAGGTALALHIGHRYSHDLDFFSNQDELESQSRQNMLKNLETLNLKIIENHDGNLLITLEDILVGFFSYDYKLIEPTSSLEGINLASLVDIGLMKLDAIISRGSRKDYYDLYFISQHHSLTDILKLSEEKYPHSRDFNLMAVESLLQFENADRDHQPQLIDTIPWDSIKQYFVEQAQNIGKEWFN